MLRQIIPFTNHQSAFNLVVIKALQFFIIWCGIRMIYVPIYFTYLSPSPRCLLKRESSAKVYCFDLAGIGQKVSYRCRDKIPYHTSGLHQSRHEPMKANDIFDDRYMRSSSVYDGITVPLSSDVTPFLIDNTQGFSTQRSIGASMKVIGSCQMAKKLATEYQSATGEIWILFNQ